MTECHRRREPHWVNIAFLGSTPILALILVPWYLWTHSVSAALWVVFVLSCAATSMSITLGYHRLFAHRSFEARSWVHFLTLFFGAGAFQGSALQWGSDHRRHHRFVDQADDPYNINQGFFWAHIGWLFFKDPKPLRTQFAPDLLKNRLIYFQHRFYVPLAVSVGFLLPWWAGWMLGNPTAGLILVGLGRLVFTQHCTFLINSACHCLGRRPYSLKISARDSVLLALFTYGEGYHNYHHKFQADYRNGIRWYHWDPTKWIIRLLALTGNAWRLNRVAPQEILKARLQTEQSRLLSRGIPVEVMAPLQARIEAAQTRMRQLHQDYMRLKASMKSGSRLQLVKMRAELKIARLEFQGSVEQWRSYYKTLLALPIAT